ncbi:unnamed protein product [Cladocopium goreaui]|uniref:Myosin-2 n=1 Tax=Cladocopium goreaui TaxID=2562237 RepID=A0A9P1GE30_9DINO|nr:unnamed protein product [Cladocopium goreaui]
MGATLAAHCCATEDEDGQAAMKGLKKDVAFVSIPLDGKHMVEHLQGNWYRQGDAKHVGEINGGYLFWNPQWGLRDVASQLSEGQSGLLEVKIENEIRYATVTLSPAAIMWADGDIWVQKLDAPNKTPRKSC